MTFDSSRERQSINIFATCEDLDSGGGRDGIQRMTVDTWLELSAKDTLSGFSRVLGDLGRSEIAGDWLDAGHSEVDPARVAPVSISSKAQVAPCPTKTKNFE